MVAGHSTYLPEGEHSISHLEVEHALRNMIAVRAHAAGFNGAQGCAVKRVVSFVHELLATLTMSSTLFAESANRQLPTVHDVIGSLAYVGMSMHELSEFSAQRRASDSRAAVTVVRPPKQTPEWADPTASFLPSDSDSDLERPPRRRRRGKAAADWNALMQDIVPDHLPPQPPRHCWKFTPVYATQMLSELPALQLVNRKLDNARLVESSLRKLIRNTDNAALQPEDKEARALEHGMIEEVGLDGSTTRVSMPMHPAADESAPAQDAKPGDAPSAPPENTDAPAASGAAPAGESAQPANAGADDAQSDQSDVQEDAPRPVRMGERHVLPRIVNYKMSWYASTTTQNSGLPNTNLYTAKLRGSGSGAGGEGRRPRRYYIN